MYHIHICIALGDRFLTTNRDNDLQKCSIFLGYFGKMRFCDTRPIKFDEQTLESLSESDDSIIIPKPPQRQPIRPANPKPKKPPKSYEPAKPTKRQLALMAKHDNENPSLSNENETPPPPPKLGRGTRNSQRAGLLPEPMETSENDKESTLNNSTDKENTEDGKKNFATKDPKNKHRGTKNPKSTREISTSRGTITIRTHSVRKVHIKKRSFKCLWCTKVFKQLKEFNHHVKDKHPDVKIYMQVLQS